MPLDALPDYVRSVRSLQRRYAGRIELRLGLECEYFEDYMPWLRDTIREYRLDYVIFGNHFYRPMSAIPISARTPVPPKCSICMRKARSGAWKPACTPIWHTPTCSCAATGDSTGTAPASAARYAAGPRGLRSRLEYQRFDDRLQRGARRWPEFRHPDFWRIAADEGCTAIVGIDAHDHRVLESGLYYDRAVRELAALGIPVIDTIPFFEY